MGRRTNPKRPVPENADTHRPATAPVPRLGRGALLTSDGSKALEQLESSGAEGFGDVVGQCLVLGSSGIYLRFEGV